MKLILASLFAATSLFAQFSPAPVQGQYTLPNGWHISPIGKAIPVQDMVLNLLPSPDGKVVLGLQCGFNPEGVAVIDTRAQSLSQQVPLRTAWLGMAWSPDHKRLYVSGGNGNGAKPDRAPIYVFHYDNGRLSQEPVGRLEETVEASALYWSGLAHHPKKPLLFAANRGTGTEPGSIVVFDTKRKKLLSRIPVEVNPYQVILNESASTLYVSNWASRSVSVIDTASAKVISRIAVAGNPNDMAISQDGRLFVSCANDNSVVVIDLKSNRPMERISTSLSPQSPEGSTPNAMALDRTSQLLFVANADNNDIAVVRITEPGKSEVLGFVPAGWYPTAVTITSGKLYVGNSKGLGSYADPYGPYSPLPHPQEGDLSLKGLRRGSIGIIDLTDWKDHLRQWTAQVYANTPYRDELLTQAAAPTAPSVIPREVGSGSPIRHVVYIIKENRTYDQILGDLPKANGDPGLALFGRDVTPNHHALAEQFVVLDNLYTDGDVSADGHSWSDSAYATDFAEKLWPPMYSGRSKAKLSDAYVPSGGHIWDLCKSKGLTYRSYGEFAIQVSGGAGIESAPGVGNLYGHYTPGYRKPGMRDTENAALFLREFEEFDKHFESSDPALRMPNFTIMSLPEDHTKGTTPGAYTPRACVGNNDYALGQIVDRLSHSRYWPEMAIFIIEDDAQDGPDHVDARRTVGFAISPYIRRQTVDSTMYSTSSMLRSIELLLGLPPMSQFDAAATPMYSAFGTTPDLTPYNHLKPAIDLSEKNTNKSYGARASKKMDFDDVDRAPMSALNEILWKSIKGADSPMPLPVHRFQFPVPAVSRE